ncbi:MAG: hypothetical protein SFW62_01020 [Alphaproteobacteria bacterium]|nr:hypothetical protein [Alphaproteobacteria bacterium]
MLRELREKGTLEEALTEATDQAQVIFDDVVHNLEAQHGPGNQAYDGMAMEVVYNQMLEFPLGNSSESEKEFIPMDMVEHILWRHHSKREG